MSVVLCAVSRGWLASRCCNTLTAHYLCSMHKAALDVSLYTAVTCTVHLTFQNLLYILDVFVVYVAMPLTVSLLLVVLM